MAKEVRRMIRDASQGVLGDAGGALALLTLTICALSLPGYL